MNNEVYAIAPCLSRNKAAQTYKIYWLFWSDLWYVFGAFFYLFCDFKVFITDDPDVTKKILRKKKKFS
jgi:predicted membrane channel-forming protein YqfA (hemolysin III family)